ncbi:MAG: OadG family protein [Bacteroidales bacterium]
MITNISLDFSNIDVTAWTIFIVGWTIIFISLISLSLIFRAMPKILSIGGILKKRKLKKETQLEKENGKPDDGEISGEITAAIGYALNLYFAELHDDEERVLTVVHKSRKYSPWNSKIYNVMQFKR